MPKTNAVHTFVCIHVTCMHLILCAVKDEEIALSGSSSSLKLQAGFIVSHLFVNAFLFLVNL